MDVGGDRTQDPCSLASDIKVQGRFPDLPGFAAAVRGEHGQGLR
ncbi:hypothetical protein [Streptomyces globosus]